MAQLFHGFIRNNVSALFAGKFRQRLGQRTAFEINFLRHFVPIHIFAAFRYGFYVHKMFYSNVFAYGVAAPRAATQRQRRRQFEVVHVADCTLGRRNVNQRARGGHILKNINVFFVGFVRIQNGSMAGTAV